MISRDVAARIDKREAKGMMTIHGFMRGHNRQGQESAKKMTSRTSTQKDMPSETRMIRWEKRDINVDSSALGC